MLLELLTVTSSLIAAIAGLVAVHKALRAIRICQEIEAARRAAPEFEDFDEVRHITLDPDLVDASSWPPVRI
jgi:chromosome segregation ATPase